MILWGYEWEGIFMREVVIVDVKIEEAIEDYAIASMV